VTTSSLTRHRRISTLVLVACAGLFGALCDRYDVVQDDAYISLVYSKNFVAGEGLVFNLGERVEGYTNFLWVMLLALPHALSIDAVWMARLFGTLAAAGLILSCWRAAASLSTRPSGFALLAAPCLLAANGALAFWSVSGMETTAFALLVTCAASRYLQRSRSSAVALDGYTGALFGLAALTRPEGWMFFGLTVLHQGFVLLRLRQVPRNMMQLTAAPLTFAALVLPHLLFRILYYGHPLPNTFYAKTGISLTHLTHGLRYSADFFLDYGLAGIIPLVTLLLLKRRRLRLQLSYIALLVLANSAYATLVGGDTLAENRLYLPITALLMAAFVEAARAGLLRLCGRRRYLPVFVLTMSAVVALFVLIPDQDLIGARDASTSHNAKLQELADYANATGNPFDLVASTAIGIPRYRTEASVLDLVGLTDETIAHSPQRLPGIQDSHILRNYHARYAMDRKPDAILFITGVRPGTPAEKALFLSRRFRRDYRLTYLQDHRPVYLRRAEAASSASMYKDGRFVERYAEGLAIMGQDPAGAIERFHDAIRLGPDDFAMPHNWIGRLHYENGRLPEADQHLRRAVAIDSTVVMSWAHLALMESDNEEAQTMARTAVALAPRSHFCHYVLGRVLLEAAQPAEALVELTVAVRLGGAQAEDGLYRLGLAAKRSGDTDSARQAWTSLLAQQPDHVAARQALRRLPAKTGAS